MPRCWQGLVDFDKKASLTDLRAAISNAVAQGDPLLAEYLRDRLAEMIGGNADTALTVLGWATQASGPELGILMGSIKESSAVRDPRVASALLATGEQKSAASDLRGSALEALETQHRLDEASIGRMKAIAMDDDAESAAWIATRTLGRVMNEDFKRTGSYQAYWKELLSVGKDSPETGVQLLALEMPSYADPILEDNDLEVLTKLLMTDPDRSVREMAAHRLSVTRSPNKVLAIYQQAFPAEQDECVRWAIFRFTVRVGGAGAMPILAAYAALDPRFKDDHQDFMAIYAAGTVDFERVWMGKVERHQCVLEEGMPH
ncbi:hypothetical protein [Chondromyces crocatus]|nr:hypothetical protein [Chondromyces crocatus]